MIVINRTAPLQLPFFWSAECTENDQCCPTGNFKNQSQGWGLQVINPSPSAVGRDALLRLHPSPYQPHLSPSLPVSKTSAMSAPPTGLTLFVVGLYVPPFTSSNRVFLISLIPSLTICAPYVHVFLRLTISVVRKRLWSIDLAQATVYFSKHKIDRPFLKRLQFLAAYRITLFVPDPTFPRLTFAWMNLGSFKHDDNVFTPALLASSEH